MNETKVASTIKQISGNYTSPINTLDVVQPTVEIRIPISPNEKYLRMVHYFLASLQMFGGPISRSAHCVISVSPDEPVRDLLHDCPWAKEFSIEFQWVNNKLFKHRGYNGTVFHRLTIDSSADIIILADADLLVAGDFDRVILKAHHPQQLLGFIAHVSPFDNPEIKQVTSKQMWNRIFEAAGLPEPKLKRVHTGWGVMSMDTRHQLCPDYFNHGFIVSPRQYIEKMCTSYELELDAVDSVIETWFKTQIANTLALTRHGIPCSTLPLNYNFPLHVSAKKIRALNPDPDGADSDDDVKIFHYLGEGEFNKGNFSTNASFEEMLNRNDVSEIGSVFQRTLQTVHEKFVHVPVGINSHTSLLHENTTARSKRLSMKNLISALFSRRITNPRVIFVCGGRRTGTTLMSAFLCSDPRSNVLGPEIQILTRIVESYQWGRENFEHFGQFYFGNLKTYRTFFRETATQLVQQVAKRVSPGGVLVLKNPELSRVLPDLIELFPDALFLATVRDPRDQIASELEVGSRQKSAGHHVPHFDSRDMLTYSKLYLSYTKVIMKIHSEEPERINIFRYEDLIMQTKKSLADLTEISGLELTFDPSKPWPRVSPLAGLQSHPARSDLYGAPINTRSMGRFERDLNAEEIHIIQTACAHLMDKFGYQNV